MRSGKVFLMGLTVIFFMASFASSHKFEGEQLLLTQKSCKFIWEQHSSKASLKIVNTNSKGLVLNFDLVLVDKVGHVIYKEGFKKLKLGSGKESIYQVSHEAYRKIKEYVYEVRLLDLKIRKRLKRKS